MSNNVSDIHDVMRVAARVRVKIIVYRYDRSVLHAGERDITANKAKSAGDENPSAV